MHSPARRLWTQTPDPASTTRNFFLWCCCSISHQIWIWLPKAVPPRHPGMQLYFPSQPSCAPLCLLLPPPRPGVPPEPAVLRQRSCSGHGTCCCSVGAISTLGTPGSLLWTPSSSGSSGCKASAPLSGVQDSPWGKVQSLPEMGVVSELGWALCSRSPAQGDH